MAEGYRSTYGIALARVYVPLKSRLAKRRGAWDNDSRKIATQNPTGINLTSTLDGASNRLVLADPYGRTTYTHDIQSRVTKIQNPLNEVTSIQCDALDREQHRVLGNGGSVSHVYDAGGRETVLQNISAAGVAQAVFTNAYDALSNRLSVIELDNTRVSFSYDKTSQIVNEQRTGANAYNTTYVWDPLGNRLQEISSGLTTTRTFSPTNSQLVSVPPAGPATTNTWDPNGNLAVENTGGALTTSTWDPENRLSHVAFSDGTSESYLTSQDGVRKSKTTGSGTTVYTWDDENVLLETNTSNLVQARFTDYPGGEALKIDWRSCASARLTAAVTKARKAPWRLGRSCKSESKRREFVLLF